MSTKENFVKALKEITGFDEPSQKVNNQASKMRIEPVRVEIEKPEIKDESFSGSFAESYSEITRQEFAKFSNAEKTNIPAGMKILGNIESTDRIEMMGRVEGDITTSDNAIVTGAVLGNISAGNLLLQNSAVRGNLKATGDITVERGAVVIGNISAENLRLDGKVKGDISVAQASELTSGALVNGNIETMFITTSSGTRIRGNIITKQAGDFDDDAEFDIEV